MSYGLANRLGSGFLSHSRRPRCSSVVRPRLDERIGGGLFLLAIDIELFVDEVAALVGPAPLLRPLESDWGGVAVLLIGVLIWIGKPMQSVFGAALNTD